MALLLATVSKKGAIAEKIQERFKMRQCYLFQDLILPMSEFPFCTSPIIPVQLPFLPSDPKPPALGGRIRYVKFMACCNQKLRQ